MQNQTTEPGLDFNSFDLDTLILYFGISFLVISYIIFVYKFFKIIKTRNSIRSIDRSVAPEGREAQSLTISEFLDEDQFERSETMKNWDSKDLESKGMEEGKIILT